MLKLSQEGPAHKIYAFERGWWAMRAVLQGMMRRTRQVRDTWIDHGATLRYLVSEQLAPVRWVVWLVVVGIHAAVRIQYIPALLLMALFLVSYTIVLPLWATLSLLGIGILSVGNFCSAKIRRATFRCPACYKGMELPIYLCPMCQAEHTRLQPCVYGVFWHRCVRCEMRLPTLDFCGRKRLARLCPHCRQPLSNAIGEGPGVHIALVGSTSAGKTSHLIIALHELKHAYTKNYRYQVTWPDPAQEQDFEASAQRLKAGQMLPATRNIVPSATLLRVRSPRGWLPRLVYFYDPAGVAFESDELAGRQGYYRYSDGLVFLIDPLAIPAFYQRRAESEQLPVSSLRPHNFQIEYTYERMMRAFEALAGFSKERRYRQSIAVVVTRVDLPGLEEEIGLPAAHALMAHDSSIASQQDALHRCVRDFLCTYELDNLVRDIESHFSSVRYFSCSALGCPPDQGSKFAPVRVLDPVTWLLKRMHVIG